MGIDTIPSNHVIMGNKLSVGNVLIAVVDTATVYGKASLMLSRSITFNVIENYNDSDNSLLPQ